MLKCDIRYAFLHYYVTPIVRFEVFVVTQILIFSDNIFYQVIDHIEMHMHYYSLISLPHDIYVCTSVTSNQR